MHYDDDSKMHYGVYRGVCKDIADPLNKNRIRLVVPQILGDQITNWAEACTPVTDNSTHDAHSGTLTTTAATVSTFGSHTHSVPYNLTHSKHISVPKLNQGVWVMFEGGDPNFPIWIGVY